MRVEVASRHHGREKMERTIKCRTGWMSVSPGVWWAQHREDGKLTVVQVTVEFGVMFIGNLSWPDLDEALEHIELLAKISEP